MKKTLLLVCLVSALATTVLAEERRLDTATYRLEEPTMPSVGQPVQALGADASLAAPVQVPAALAELRARHLGEVSAMDAALLAARDEAERQSLELRAVAMKQRQQQEELGWLRSNALATGDAAYAARLDEALQNLEPVAAPVATRFVPRDPATGLALDGQEGGAQ